MGWKQRINQYKYIGTKINLGIFFAKKIEPVFTTGSILIFLNFKLKRLISNNQFYFKITLGKAFKDTI